MTPALCIIEDKHGTRHTAKGYYWGDGAFWCESPDVKSKGLYTSGSIEWPEDPTRLYRAPALPFEEDSLDKVSVYRLVRVMLGLPKSKTKK